MRYSNYSSRKRKIFDSVLQSQHIDFSYPKRHIDAIGWLGNWKKYVINKSKNQTNHSFFIKKQALASTTKKQRCIRNPVKHLRRSSSGELKGLPDSLPHPHLVFVTVNQVEVFSRNITLSVTGFNLRNVQHFKWSSTLKLSDGLRIKHCYWTRTKVKRMFIDFGWKKRLMPRQLDCCLGWLG